MVGFKGNQINKTIFLLILVTIIVFLSKTSSLIADGSSNFESTTENLKITVEIKPEILTTSEEIRLKINPILKNKSESLKNSRIDILACFNSCNIESNIQKIKGAEKNFGICWIWYIYQCNIFGNAWKSR